VGQSDQSCSASGRLPRRAGASLAALDASGREQADAELEPIAWARTAIAGRTYLPRVTRGRVCRRDRFACRYCGAQVIPIPIMELLGTVFGERFP
jgi:hypothetical protein